MPSRSVTVHTHIRAYIQYVLLMKKGNIEKQILGQV